MLCILIEDRNSPISKYVVFFGLFSFLLWAASPYIVSRLETPLVFKERGCYEKTTTTYYWSVSDNKDTYKKLEEGKCQTNDNKR